MPTKSPRAAKTGTSKKTPAKKGAAKTAAKKAAGKAGKSDDSIYTDPALRERLKKRIMAGDKGGKAGQWSARKAQLLAHEYEQAGGGYKRGARKGEAQKSLQRWGEEQWQTSDKKSARRAGGTTRYLPKKAWNKLTPAEKRATNEKKQAGSRAGKQFVSNTAAAKKARRKSTAK